MTIYSKIATVQETLKAPKNQRNNFGKYNYRSLEDINEAAKPVLAEHGLALAYSDEIVMVGDRIYVKATCVVFDVETGDRHEVQAFAREALTKKGMDESQITGTASSYARKYAANGMFALDDTKDADSNEYQQQQSKSTNQFQLDQTWQDWIEGAFHVGEVHAGGQAVSATVDNVIKSIEEQTGLKVGKGVKAIIEQISKGGK